MSEQMAASEHSMFKQYTTDVDVVAESQEELDVLAKAYSLTIVDIEWDGPGGGWPCVTFQGRAIDLAKFLSEQQYELEEAVLVLAE